MEEMKQLTIERKLGKVEHTLNSCTSFYISAGTALASHDVTALYVILHFCNSSPVPSAFVPSVNDMDIHCSYMYMYIYVHVHVM